MSLRRNLQAMPTLLRVGLAETIAYRAEMVVWILTTTMPLVMLSLWTSVASEQAFAHYGTDDFVAYYLGALMVRNLTSNWVAYQISEEIRLGTLSMRLLRPIHPFAGYLATHLAALPLRAVVVLPVAAVLLISDARHVVVADPARLGLFAASIACAWLLVFATFLTIGTLSFFLEKSLSLVEAYFGLFMLLSGYLIPLDLMPWWIRDAAQWLPFRFMLSAPLEILIGRHDVAGCVRVVGLQAAWATVMLLAGVLAWRRGIARFEAYGA